MTPTELQKITRRYHAAVCEIADTMTRHEVSAEDGETLLLHIAGLSAGNRQQPINGADWLLPISLAWKFAAEHGG